MTQIILTHRSNGNAGCKVTAATIIFRNTEVNEGADISISRVARFTRAYHIDLRLCANSMLMAASIIFTTQIWSWTYKEERGLAFFN